MNKPLKHLSLGLALLLGGLVALMAQGPAGVSPELAASLLAEKVRLATSGRFYLELSVSESRISICHSGVSVQTYPIQAISVGSPRIFFVPGNRPAGWIGQTWTLGHLEPAKVVQRVLIKPGDASTTPTPDSPDVLPPTLEELTAVPRAYSIQFDNQQAIQVLLDGDIPGSVLEISPMKNRWGEFLAALGVRTADRIRVRISLKAADGASLFRSFPDDPPELLILP